MTLDAAQEYTVEIAASQADCFAAVVDFERYPTWASAVVQTRVLTRGPSDVARTVEFHVDAKLKTIRYVLEYTGKKPSRLSWRSIDGDVELIEGTYRFRKLAPTRTEATCRQEIRLGFWLPGPLRTLAARTALQQSVSEFKLEVERRVGAEKPRGRRARDA